MQKFIDLGWHTVPLKGKLERLPNGDKTIPKFEKGWKKKYKEEFNEQVTAIGGVITGAVSNIIAIDCDNDTTFELFKQLDPDYEAIMYSKGKGEGKENCGTFIYTYEDGIDTHSPSNGDLALDVYSNDGFIYLPTANNSSKHCWNDIPTIRAMPMATRLILQQLQRKTEQSDSSDQHTGPQNRPCLNPLLTQFVGKRGEFIPSLFKVITPRSFRDEEQYVKYGYLHPKNVPTGRGSEYLSKLSAILGADESVDEALYVDCMHFINELFTEPMDYDRYDKTILTPMLEGRTSIDGKQIWQYNEHWSEQRYTITTKHGLIVDLGFDDERELYYYLDMTNEKLKHFNRDTEFLSFLGSITQTTLPKRALFKQKLPIVHVKSNPAIPFGFNGSDTPQVLSFNSFKPSVELSIIHKPETYAKHYKEPTHILKYIKCLVPDKNARNYLLQFIKRKLMFFEYSPVILYFLGVPGSGKDTFFSLLASIIDAVARPTVKEFLEVYNAYLLDTYFVQLDEYGDQLNKIADKEEAKGKIKAYTGKNEIQIRDMRQTGYPYKHSITFGLTANKNPLMLDEDDRRVHLMETPNILSLQPWYSAEVRDKMFEEIKDFCYYLATEVPLMSKDDYVTPPVSDSKHRLIADSMFAAQKIVYALKHNMHEYLIELATDNNAPLFAEGIRNKRFSSDALEQLYDELTDYKGDAKTIRKILRKEGFKAIPTTKDGMKTYYYPLDDDPFAEGV